jgi:hypothetical protein
MELEQLMQKSKEEKLPWGEADMNRMHEQIMARVVQTRIEKRSSAQKFKNYMHRNWRIWAQSSILFSGLMALVVLSVDKGDLYLKSVSYMNNSQARHQEIIRSIKNQPNILSSTVLIQSQDADFFVDLAYHQSKKKEVRP